MTVNLKSLIGKLNDVTRNALEGAAGLCMSRAHYDVEIEHYLMKLLDNSDGDFIRILRQFEIEKTRFSVELSRSLDKMKSGNARTPSFSPSLVRMFTEAWTIGSIDYGVTQVRSGFTVLALLANEELARMIRDVSKEFQKINAESLRKDFFSIIAGSREETVIASAQGAPSSGQGAAAGSKTPFLDQYTVDLTANAAKGKVDPVLGRFRNSSGRRYSDATSAKQSDPYR